MTAEEEKEEEEGGMSWKHEPTDAYGGGAEVHQPEEEETASERTGEKNKCSQDHAVDDCNHQLFNDL